MTKIVTIALLSGLSLFIIGLIPSCKKKIKLEDTVVSVKEIKGIGELISAEYYGEVLSSLSMIESESIDTVLSKSIRHLHQLKTKVDTNITFRVDNRIAKVESSLKQKPGNKRLLKKLNRLINRRERKRLRYFKKNLTGDEKASLDFVGDVLGEKEKDVLKNFKAGKTIDSTALILYKEEIKKFKENQIEEDLAYLARGTVRAGYDLTELDSLNIFVSPSRDTIYFLDLDPILLEVSINPYFYFECDTTSELTDSLYGFDLVYADKGGNVSFDQITQLKTECKDKLRLEALERDIYDIAHDNAENSLLGFFKLFSLEAGQPVNKVIIAHSKYFEYKADYLYDGRIDATEAEEIQSLFDEDKLSLDELAFPLQTHDYQLDLLHKFMNDLHRETLQASNSPLWRDVWKQYLSQSN